MFMKIEVWSDIACPFCFIGKNRLENALTSSGLKDLVSLDYKTFLLNPEQKTDTGLSLADYMVKIKGMPNEQIISMFKQITETGKSVNIDFNFENVIPANTLKAHKLLQLSSTAGKQSEVKSSLFKAYFQEGKNIDDEEVLISIGREQGILESEIQNAFKSEEIHQKINSDLREAAEYGISGVPFFIFNQKYAVSGAQSEEVFRQVLDKVAEEEKAEKKLQIIDGENCSNDGNCN